jgi:hypothetical protein
VTTVRQLLPLIIALTVTLAASAPAPSQEPPERAVVYAKDVRPLLAKYCFSCHGSAKPKADLNLAAIRDEDVFVKPAIWNTIRERLADGEMPPRDKPQPTNEERQRLITFSDGVLARHTIDGHPDPGPLNPRRLNVREHMNVFRDLVIALDRAQPRKATFAAKPDGSINLYHAIVPPEEHPCDFAVRILPPDTQDGGFDSIGENLSIPPFLMEKYFRASKVLLDDMFSQKGRDEHGRYQWRLRELVDRVESGPLPRGMTTRREALAALLKDFATRAFRRPVSAEEIEKYVELFERSQANGDDFQTAIRWPLQAILLSPRCVILWTDDDSTLTRSASEEESASLTRSASEEEIASGKRTAAQSDSPSPARRTEDNPSLARRVGVRALDDYELATRLSIFLWSSVPDRELWQMAEQGRLQDDQVLQQQVRRMLGDRRVTDGLHPGFVCQWLQLEHLDRSAPDAEQYPLYFQHNLAELMKQELLLFTDAVLVEDRSILEFIDADWGFLCYPLAEHYGIENFPGKKPPSNADPPWYRIKFPDKRRGGVLTMGKVLTGTSQPVRTSPVHRGKWVLEAILGAPPPPPPPEVDNVLKEETDAGKQQLTVPQLLAKHRDNPACYSCHQRIDPLGMAFERFDPVGRWRDTDRGQPIEARGTLIDGATFDGIGELKTLLMSRRDEFVRCFVEQMLAYSLGRKLRFYDEPTVKKIVQAVAEDNYKFSRVVVEVALSYPFRHRRIN